ncbi:MAG TPA: hypothetical protein DEQ84_05690 [Prevotellaceae bacterium]|nr:hypothetical protein [Prevotellaceae bacterium]
MASCIPKNRKATFLKILRSQNYSLRLRLTTFSLNFTCKEMLYFQPAESLSEWPWCKNQGGFEEESV